LADRSELRRVLLRRPWMLETDAAEWVVSARIGFCSLRYLHSLPPPADYGIHDCRAVRCPRCSGDGGDVAVVEVDGLMEAATQCGGVAG
jgi:hypothetical protein